MLITEAQMGMSRSVDALSLLGSMQYINESVYSPAMVPIVENTSLNANIIALESMTEFCEANDFTDFGAALKAVCEASEVDPSTICFSVQEENVIADQDMAELVAGIMNEGVGVVVKPLSSQDDAVVIAEATLDYAFQTGDYSLFEAYLADDFDTLSEAFLQEDKLVNKGIAIATQQGKNPNIMTADQLRELARSANPLQTRAGRAKMNTSGETAQDRIMAKRLAGGKTDIAAGPESLMRKGVAAGMQKAADDKRAAQDKEAELNLRASHIGLGDSNPGRKPWTPASDLRTDIDKNAEFNEKYGKPLSSLRQDSAPASAESAKKTVDAIKDAADKKQSQDPKGFRNWCAKQIAALHNMMNKFNKEVKDAGDNAPWYKKLLSYIAKAIQWLTAKMHNAVAKDGANFLDKRYDAA